MLSEEVRFITYAAVLGPAVLAIKRGPSGCCNQSRIVYAQHPSHC